MEYPTFYEFDRNETSDLYNKMKTIKSALDGVESYLINHYYDPDASACSFVSTNINPQKTYFATEISNSSSPKIQLNKLDWRSIFILNPLPHTQIQYIIDKLEQYIGKVARAEYVWAINEQQVVLYVKFKYWYDTLFNRVFRSELIITQEKNKHSYTKNTVDLHLDFNQTIFNVLLCKRKSSESNETDDIYTNQIVCPTTII